MKIYYGGGEQNTWRTFLHENGVNTVSLSWYGLRRRRSDLRSYRIADEFPAGMKVFLDSGAFSLNKIAETTQDEAYDLAQDYMDFVERNAEAIEFASEFDALALGRPLLLDLRHQFWENLPGDKWMAVWHSEWGSGNLRELAGRYERVGILQSDGSNQDVSSLLRTLASGTNFHGIAMTKMELMRDLPLDSVGSTSWLSPTQYGDTFIWDGQELHRYPKKYKHRRAEHRAWLESKGFDTQLIEDDNNHELLRLSLWSWQNFADSIHHREVTTSLLTPFPAPVEIPQQRVDPLPEIQRSRELVPRRERQLLPIMQTQVHTVAQPDGTEVSQTILRPPTGSFIRCDTCHIQNLCTEFQAGSECAFEIPVEIRTSTQLEALQAVLIEMQTRRVLRMTMIEEVEGGHRDQSTSEEYDRLQRMIDKKINNAKERSPLIQMAVNASNAGGPGFISRMWGEATAERVTELPAAINSDSVVDAELVDG
jgi:hypothetical protein